MLKGFLLAPHPDCDGEPACLCTQCMSALEVEVTAIEADWHDNEAKAARTYPIALRSDMETVYARLAGVIGLPSVPHYLTNLDAYKRVVSRDYLIY